MTSRERVLRTLRREGQPDRLPFEISWGAFVPSLMAVYRKRTGATVGPDEHLDFDTRSIDLNPTRRKTDFRSYFRGGVPSNVNFDEWGAGSTPGTFEHFAEYNHHPLVACETVREIENYAWPDVTEEYRYEGLDAKTVEFQRRGYAVTGELYQTIFERAWLLRGIEPMMMDFVANPEIAHAICEQIAQRRIQQARRYARMGVDILRLGDDVCMQTGAMFSLETYRTFLKERTRAIVRAAKEIKPDLLVFMHCDGKIDRLIPEYLDIGIDILNPVQPECNDLAAIQKRHGSRLSFWGGVGTQTTMPFGTPKEVAACVRQLKEILGPNGGLLVAPTHILEPEVPWENIEAFVAAAKSTRY
jgi:uroporphyrinogen decarboxylase